MAIKVQKPPHKIVALSYLPYDQLHEIVVKHVTSRNQPKCNHSIYDYMRLVVVCN